jgi:hypothetical protein
MIRLVNGAPQLPESAKYKKIPTMDALIRMEFVRPNQHNANANPHISMLSDLHAPL